MLCDKNRYKSICTSNENNIPKHRRKIYFYGDEVRNERRKKRKKKRIEITENKLAFSMIKNNYSDNEIMKLLNLNKK